MSNIEICHTETAPLRTWTNPEKYFQVWNTMKEDRQNTFRYGMSKKKKWWNSHKKSKTIPEETAIIKTTGNCATTADNHEEWPIIADDVKHPIVTER